MHLCSLDLRIFFPTCQALVGLPYRIRLWYAAEGNHFRENHRDRLVHMGDHQVASRRSVWMEAVLSCMSSWQKCLELCSCRGLVDTGETDCTSQTRNLLLNL